MQSIFARTTDTHRSCLQMLWYTQSHFQVLEAGMDTLAWSQPIFPTSSLLASVVEGMAGNECVCVCYYVCVRAYVCVKRVAMSTDKGDHECREG